MIERAAEQVDSWRVVDESEGWVTVGLMSDGGEKGSRVTGARTAVLTSFLTSAVAERRLRVDHADS